MPKTLEIFRHVDRWSRPLLSAAVLLFTVTTLKAEDGYRLWLRYDRLPEKMIVIATPRVTSIVVPGESPTLKAIRSELHQGFMGLFGRLVPASSDITSDGAVIVGTPESTPLITRLGWEKQLAALGLDGFRISSTRIRGRFVTVIASSSEIGALYGAFHFLRLIQTAQTIDRLNITEKPNTKQPMGRSVRWAQAGQHSVLTHLVRPRPRGLAWQVALSLKMRPSATCP